jgi:tRNA U34 5-methylaminomethyl-2-thiouridine-forming methyltransferase MnmC
MARAHAAFPELADFSARLLAGWENRQSSIDLGAVHLDIIEGDARETLPGWTGLADAWFLDGFAPAKNPGLCAADLMASVGEKTAQGGTFATYTAAGHVRRALEQAGFAVERVPGFGRKRHMSVGRT